MFNFHKKNTAKVQKKGTNKINFWKWEYKSVFYCVDDICGEKESVK
jgi:hypothetical protein